MCSLILLALNTFLATPACVTPDGPATIAAQRWGACVLEAQGYHGIARTYQRKEETILAGAATTIPPEAFVGFTWFADSMTLVVTDSRD
jgi:hypothetical protein